MELDKLMHHCAVQQKKGLHFIVASVVVWGMILVVHLLDVNIMHKNLFTFCCSAVLFPIAWLVSRWLKIDFKGESNPLTKAGIVFSINQMLYILIVMWVFAAVPEKMLMVYAMVFGAHLMPFAWLYKSRCYWVSSIAVPIGSLIIGLMASLAVLAATMVVYEALFAIALTMEVRHLLDENSSSK